MRSRVVARWATTGGGIGTVVMGGADIDGAVGSVERPLFGMVAAAGGMGVIGRTVGTSMG